MSTAERIGPSTALGDGIVQIRLPMTGNPMRYVNAYAVQDDDGLTLIDCGWRADDVLETLEDGLGAHGFALADVRRLIVTHAHFDHYGLAGTLLRRGVPELLMHPAEWAFAQSLLTDRRAADAASDAWIARNGFTAAGLEDETTHHRTELTAPARTVADGERVGSRLRAVWTPGHSAGHLCFVDLRSDRVFTGDHVLDPVTPHVGVWMPHDGDRLGDYVASLRRIAGAAGDHALPAHGEPFAGLRARVDALLRHHDERERQVVAACTDTWASAADVAARLPWTSRKRAFAQLGEMHQQFAVAETLAHLDHLVARGAALRDDAPGVIVYRAVAAA